MSFREVIRNGIFENILFSEEQSALPDDDSLLAQGIIDSVGTLEMILFLEQGFGFTVRDEEVAPQILDFVNRLVAFVDRHQKNTCPKERIAD